MLATEVGIDGFSRLVFEQMNSPIAFNRLSGFCPASCISIMLTFNTRCLVPGMLEMLPLHVALR
jgi:hypothetical protein